MDSDTREYFRQRLLALKREIENTAESARDSARPVELDQARVGRLSRMDALQTREMAVETARRREQQLAAIEGALRRIEADNYGYCFVCDEEIDPRRLEADPVATRCVSCLQA